MVALVPVTPRPTEDASSPDPDDRTTIVPSVPVDVPEPTGEVEVERLPTRRAAPVRTGYLPPLEADAWPVGFSPTGTALPETLTDVLVRGSHAIRSAKRAEAERHERAEAIGAHVEEQVAAFLAMCSAQDLRPPVTVRVVSEVPLAARLDERSTRPQEILAQRIPSRTEGTSRRQSRRESGRGESGRGESGRDESGRDESGRDGRGHRAAATPPRPPKVRRERLHAWPILYWRCESFPSAGRSLHLFVEPNGRMFEGRDDPWPLTSLGQQVRVWPVDAPTIVEAMAEVDARRCAVHLVHGMAHLLWRAGVGL